MLVVGLGNNNLHTAGVNKTWARLRFTQADTIFQVREHYDVSLPHLSQFGLV